MYTEKRRQFRVDTHIPTKMIVKETMERLHGFLADLREDSYEYARMEQDYQNPRNLYGYVENISEGGIGVSSLDTLLPGAEVMAAIEPIETEIVISSAILVFSRADNSLYYYGFRFIWSSRDEQQAVKGLIRSLR